MSLVHRRPELRCVLRVIQQGEAVYNRPRTNNLTISMLLIVVERNVEPQVTEGSCS